MTKQNIIDIVSDATGLTKVETEAVMNGVMKTIIDALAENERVELRGFGTFGVKHRMPKKASFFRHSMFNTKSTKTSQFDSFIFS